MINEIRRYIQDGKVIETLTPLPGGQLPVAGDGRPEVSYYLVMDIRTPQGLLPQRPRIEAATLEEAFSHVAVTEQMVFDALRAEMNRPRIVT